MTPDLFTNITTPKPNLITNIEQERLNYIRLARSTNIGSSMFFRLIDIFGTASEALDKFDEVIRPKNLKAKRKIAICSSRSVHHELEKVSDFGAKIITAADYNYPNSLREISNPPPVITIKGQEQLLNQHKIAIVGARNSSMSADFLAKKTASELGMHKVVVVSGLAKGVDVMAHQGAIENGTIAAIAGGINRIYPAQNRKIYEKISQKGLLISENPFNCPPQPFFFARRNRIISGLSMAIIVIEAGEKSGTLITVKYALAQGRKVFVAPGYVLDDRYKGSNELLDKENILIYRNIRDILRKMPIIKQKIKEPIILKESQPKSFIAPVAKLPNLDEISKLRDEIYQKLSVNSITIEEIINFFNAPAKLVNIALIQLEIMDKIIIDFDKVIQKG